MKRSVILMLASLAAVAAVANAQTPSRPGAPPVRESVRKACANDAQTLCAGKQERERSLCLVNNLERLSPPCRDALSQPTASPRPPPKPN